MGVLFFLIERHPDEKSTQIFFAVEDSSENTIKTTHRKYPRVRVFEGFFAPSCGRNCSLYTTRFVITMRREEENTACEEPLEGALEELLLVEEYGHPARGVQLRVLERVLRVDVLVEDAQRQHRLRRVEQVVDGDEEWLEQRLNCVR